MPRLIIILMILLLLVDLGTDGKIGRQNHLFNQLPFIFSPAVNLADDFIRANWPFQPFRQFSPARSVRTLFLALNRQGLSSGGLSLLCG